MDRDEYIRSAVESEITRMLAKTSALQNVPNESYDPIIPDPPVKVKQEPKDEMEEEQQVIGENDSPADYITEDPGEGDYSMVQSMAAAGTGGGKYSVKVVTKYMCRYCARQFNSPDEMQDHIASHARGKTNQSHNCYVCGKVYSTPSKLQRHVRVHSGERPYACNICGRRFTRSDHVKQHLKVHMPQKQKNTCRLCNQKFLRRQSLHSHLQQAHGLNTIYTCHRCGEAFDEITKLHSHKNSHVNIYGKNEGPAVAGGMVIKQEPGTEHDPDVPMIGLAKFSLGPQPAPEELIQIMNQCHQQKTGEVANASGCVSDETHKLAVSLPKAVNSSAKPLTAARSYPLKYLQDVAQTEEPPEEMETQEEEEEMEGGTVSDGMNMFILPSDIKKEPEDPDEGNTSYVDDIAAEQDDRDGPNGDDIAQNLLTRPPEEHKGIKMKLFGPASYKAMKVAMRNKIAMKTPSLRQRKDASGSGLNNPVPVSLSGPNKQTFAPYSSSISGDRFDSKGPVEESLSREKEKKLSKCEHCCIWFEDYTMCLLHNSLHSADDGDPFTCRKCLKKLGNRLEFTAHLVWHLEPDMDN